MPKKNKATEQSATVAQDEIIYATPSSEFCLKATGNPLTVEKAKELIGWTEETEEIKFKKGEYVEELEGYYPRKVQLRNNPMNRPITIGNFLDLRQTILNNRWEFNGEPMIIGKTGKVLNGQHTTLALVLAEFERTEGENKEHWGTMYPEPFTVEKLIVYGISEDAKVVDTMDTCKSRTLTDVIYRSGYFKTVNNKPVPPSEQAKISKVMEHAVRLLWDRTGAGLDAYSPRRTTLECVNFINRHPRLVECVQHIWVENGETKDVARYLPLGVASGLLYLMGASATNGEAYRELDVPSESVINWKNWKKAKAFWTNFCSSSEDVVHKFNFVRLAITSLENEETGHTGTVSEKIAIINKAWEVFFADGDFHADRNDPLKRAKELLLNYHKSEKTGTVTLLEKPDFGGIDLVDQKKVEPEPEPTEEEMQDEKEKIKEENGHTTEPTNSIADELAKLKKTNNDGLLLFLSPKGTCKLFEEDATTVAKILDLKTKKRADKLTVLEFNRSDLPSEHPGKGYLAMIRISDLRKGKPIITVEQFDGDKPDEVTDVTKPKPKTAQPKATDQPTTPPQEKEENTPPAATEGKKKKKGVPLRGGNN